MFDSGRRLIGVTCHHVFDAYRRKREADRTTVFGVSRLLIRDIGQRVIDESQYLDLVTVDFSDLAERSSRVHGHPTTSRQLM